MSLSEPHHQPPPILSTLLLDLSASFDAERVHVQDIIDKLERRSFNFILLIFAIINSLPIVGIPGVSTITGLPILIITIQIVLGHQHIYLPKWVANSSISASHFKFLIQKVSPWLKRLERIMKPRMPFLTQGSAQRWLAGFCVPLAVALVLPIPFGNFLPGIAILFVVLGLIQRDGICVLIGITFGIASGILLSGIIWVAIAELIPAVIRFF